MERKGFPSCVQNGKERIGREWVGLDGKGVASFRCPHWNGGDRTGWERIGAEGIGVFQNSGGE